MGIISEELINQMVEKEIKDQISTYINSKKVANITKEVIKQYMSDKSEIQKIAEELYRDKEVKNHICELVADKTYSNIVNALKSDVDGADYYDYGRV